MSSTTAEILDRVLDAAWILKNDPSGIEIQLDENRTPDQNTDVQQNQRRAAIDVLAEYKSDVDLKIILHSGFTEMSFRPAEKLLKVMGDLDLPLRTCLTHVILPNQVHRLQVVSCSMSDDTNDYFLSDLFQPIAGTLRILAICCAHLVHGQNWGPILRFMAQNYELENCMFTGLTSTITINGRRYDYGTSSARGLLAMIAEGDSIPPRLLEKAAQTEAASAAWRPRPVFILGLSERENEPGYDGDDQIRDAIELDRLDAEEEARMRGEQPFQNESIQDED